MALFAKISESQPSGKEFRELMELQENFGIDRHQSKFGTYPMKWQGNSHGALAFCPPSCTSCFLRPSFQSTNHCNCPWAPSVHIRLPPPSLFNSHASETEGPGPAPGKPCGPAWLSMSGSLGLLQCPRLILVVI